MESRDFDLNLLIALDALLDERAVGAAAQRLHTSAPAMSRTLARLRRVLDDPVLVRAGRTMVATPRALAMQGEVRHLVEQARQLFTPPQRPDLSTLQRTFSVQATDVIVSTVGRRLLSRIRAEAPGVNVRFVGESHEDTHSLREGVVDLELGQIRRTEPETHIELLLTEPMVGVARKGHSFASGAVTLEDFAAAEHVVFSRRGRMSGPIDDLLADHGLRRRVVACTPTALAALFLIKDSDMVSIMPVSIVGDVVKTLGLITFDIPLDLPPFELSMAWHPRYEADGAHAWLRQRVRDTVPG
jgi:DNA-binding transcriptional LysR family regulator